MIRLYISKDTFIHRLKPGVKLLFLTIGATAMFAVSSIPVLILFLLFVALLYGIAKIPLIDVLKQLKSMSLFLILIFAFQVIFRNWYVGLEIILRFITLIFLASLVSLTTKVSDMVNSIETVLKPLQCFGINSSKIGMVLSMAIRFIPVVGKNFSEVREAQRARGFDVNIFAFAMPLIIRTINMASEVAEALEARSYDGEPSDREQDVNTIFIEEG
ncbi:energy-coupling factor transporter transmembrane component T family protein [Bartonella sp. B41]